MVLLAILLIGTGWDLWRVSPAGRAGRAARFAAADTVVPREAAPAALPDSARSPLDLNRATAAALDALPGIGPVLASRIVTRRDHVGPYRRAEDLLDVPGIGPRLFERLRPHVTVRASGQSADSMQSAKSGRGSRADSPSAGAPAFR
jgi:competence protein ComEA